MKNLKIFLFSISLILLTYGASSVKAQTAEDQPVAVFYAPHQDDELLSMGHAITRYAAEGYEVHVVLLTRGRGSNAIHHVNEKLTIEKMTPLNEIGFSRARNREFTRSVKAMGVHRENIHFSRLRDGNTTAEEVKEVVLTYKSRYPDAEHKALSYHDDHIDHRNSGVALQTLYKSGMISRPTFYIQNVEHALWDGEYEPFIPAYQFSLDNAKRAYHTWNPLQKSYSVGGISVARDFLLFDEDPRSKYHGPGE